MSTSASLAVSVVAPALVELKKRLPALTLSWQTTLMADMPMEILSKEAEVAVAAMPVTHEHLENDGSMVCCHAQSTQAGRPSS